MALTDRRVFLAAALAIVAIGLVPVMCCEGNVDVAWYLYVAHRVLGGAQLYRDIFEINPPLIVALTLPAASVAASQHVAGLAVFDVFVAALVVLCVTLAGLFLGLLLGEGRAVERREAVLLLLAALVLLPMADFGQREQLLLALLVPYLALAAVRAEGRVAPPGPALLAGALAGLGLALKPFYVPLWLSVEAYLWLRRRVGAPWKRPEAVVVVATGAAYVAAVVLVFPGYIGMVERFGPLYGWLLRQPVFGMLRSADGLLALLAIGALILSGGAEESRGVRAVLALTLAGALAAVLLQGKGWSYHYFPVRAAAFVSVGVLLRRGWPRARLARPVVACAVLVGTVVVLCLTLVRDARQAVAQARLERQIVREMTPLVRRYARGGSVVALTVSPSPAFPLVNHAGVDWAMRMPSLWMMPALYAREHWASLSDTARARRRSAAEREFIEMVTDDFVGNRPAVLILYRPPWGAPDIAGYFARADERFARAFADYRPVGQVGGYTFLAIERREP